MFSFLGSIFSAAGANLFIKVFRGVSEPIVDYYKDRNRTDLARDSVWIGALVKAAEADVENRKIAAQERSNNPFLMVLYLNVILWPSLYFSLEWADLIFGFKWQLAQAPDAMRQFGEYITITFIGGGSAAFGLIRGAKILASARLISTRK